MTAYEDAPGHLERVKRYYDRNTARFQRLGEGGASIHRAVWAPGVATSEQAVHHVDDAVLALLRDVERPRVVDLGCGVGGSLLYLARQRPDLTGDGVTISPAQAAVGASLVAEAGLGDRVRVREGDFLAPPEDLAGADLALSIEAFVHGPDPARYFAAAAGLLCPGGLLVLCDDVLTAAGATATARDVRRIEEFRAGWRLASLLTADELRRHARGAGFEPVSDADLTPWVRLRRPRDYGLRALIATSRPLRLRGDVWWSLAGGDALRHCQARRLISYRLLVFRRAGDAS
jgi:cyclopropane fatty-acyl-phospholipid synthase-like methyltransferase